MHAFSSESIPPRGLSLTHLAGKGLLVACHGHEAEKLAGMARIYIGTVREHGAGARESRGESEDTWCPLSGTTRPRGDGGMNIVLVKPQAYGKPS